MRTQVAQAARIPQKDRKVRNKAVSRYVKHIDASSTAVLHIHPSKIDRSKAKKVLANLGKLLEVPSPYPTSVAAY